MGKNVLFYIDVLLDRSPPVSEKWFHKSSLKNIMLHWWQNKILKDVGIISHKTSLPSDIPLNRTILIPKMWKKMCNLQKLCGECNLKISKMHVRSKNQNLKIVLNRVYYM